MNCQHIFLKGKKQNQHCNVENCTKHKPKILCTYILTIGKNKGNECKKNNCKKHTGLPCNFVLKNEKLCSRFNCKKHNEILKKVVEELVDSIEYTGLDEE